MISDSAVSALCVRTFRIVHETVSDSTESSLA